MGILKGLAKVALSPLCGISEVAKDLSGDNGEESTGLSILTVGASSVVKGTVKGIVNGVEDIFD